MFNFSTCSWRCWPTVQNSQGLRTWQTKSSLCHYLSQWLMIVNTAAADAAAAAAVEEIDGGKSWTCLSWESFLFFFFFFPHQNKKKLKEEEEPFLSLVADGNCQLLAKALVAIHRSVPFFNLVILQHHQLSVSLSSPSQGHSKLVWFMNHRSFHRLPFPPFLAPRQPHPFPFLTLCNQLYSKAKRHYHPDC